MGNFNDVLMEQLADNGDGNYAYVDTLDEARKLFVDDLTGTLQVIAQDAKVQVDFNPEVVRVYRLIGYENRAVADQDFRNDSVDAGEIGAGHSVTALYAVQFQPGGSGTHRHRAAALAGPGHLPGARDQRQLQHLGPGGRFGSAAAHYQLAVLAAQYAEVLRQSPWAGHISIGQIYSLAAPLPSEISWDQEVSEFVSLLSRASQMDW